jgi:hypothetical protein
MPNLKKIIIPNVKFWELNQFYVALIFSITPLTFFSIVVIKCVGRVEEKGV